MGIGITYNTLMQFSINGSAIPDPASYDYAAQSLDVEASRDTKGLLHRKMVDTKYNVAVSWNGLDYAKASEILVAVESSEFTFTFPCPSIPITVNNGLHTGKYYVGDRKVSVKKATENDKTKWIVSMSFDLIEF